MRCKIVFTTLLLLFCSITSLQAETLYLSVAASMTDAFKEIVAGFSAAHPAARLRPNFASSGSLAKQIEQGAPTDIYISANPRWMQHLIEKEMIIAGSDRIFAYNSLVLVGDKNSRVRSLDDLVTLERIALGSPQNVPAGQYAKQAMDRAGIYDILRRDRKLVMAKDVRQALLYADRGEVDVAFVYQTDAMLLRNAKVLFTVPDYLYDRVSYPLGVTTSGAEKDLAKSFDDYMSSTEAITTLSRYGFETNLSLTSP